MKQGASLLVTCLLAFTFRAQALELTIEINSIDDKGVGPAIGLIRAEDGLAGLVLTADLRGLPPGTHGFHLHQNPDCGAALKDGVMVAGLSAGGHYDPDNTGKHEGPSGHGHQGDMPVLTVEPDGTSRQRIVVPRLKAADINNHSLVIHAGGDTYSDTPQPLGGGGARIACGVIRGTKYYIPWAKSTAIHPVNNEDSEELIRPPKKIIPNPSDQPQQSGSGHRRLK